MAKQPEDNRRVEYEVLKVAREVLKVARELAEVGANPVDVLYAALAAAREGHAPDALLTSTVRAERAARAAADRAGVPWPQLPQDALSYPGVAAFAGALVWTRIAPGRLHPLLLRFMNEEWGRALVAALEAPPKTPTNIKCLGADDLSWIGANPFASPTVLALLAMLRDGLRTGRPEFEEVADRLRVALFPPRSAGRRKTKTALEEDRTLAAKNLLPIFRTAFSWLDEEAPLGAGEARLLELLRGDRAGWRRKAGVAGLRLKQELEDAMLTAIARAVANRTKGRSTSAMTRAFHSFCVRQGLAPRGSTVTAFMKRVREGRDPHAANRP